MFYKLQKSNNRVSDHTEDMLAKLEKKLNDRELGIDLKNVRKDEFTDEVNPDYDDVKYYKQQMINVEPVKPDYN